VNSPRTIGPWSGEFEADVLLDAREITRVFGYQHDAGLAARNCQEDIIGERPGHSFQINAVCVSQSSEDIAHLFPCRCGGGENAVARSMSSFVLIYFTL
jgi:hypothetical protein